MAEAAPNIAAELRLLGGVALRIGGEPASGRSAQRRRIALLALLAAAPLGVLSRDKVIGYLWPDSDPHKARRLLSEALYVLRKSLGDDCVIATGDDLSLNSAVVWCDVVAYRQALDGGDLVLAVELYAGPFLDGFYVDDAIEFEHWADGVRDRLARSNAQSLEALAHQAEAEGNASGAVDRWRALIDLDPWDAAVALRYMEALEASGRRAEALQFARKHARLLHDEFQAEPSPEVEALAQRLRDSPVPSSPDRRVPPSTPPAPVVGERGPAERSHTDPGEDGGGLPGANPTAPPTLPPAPSRGRGRLVTAGLGALVLALMGIQLWGGSGPELSEAAPGTVRIAFLPFDGPERYVPLWRTLGEYLYGRGDVTSLPNSIVRTAWSRSTDSPPPPMVADSVFGRLDATHYALTTVTEISGKLRWSLEVYEVGDPEAPIYLDVEEGALDDPGPPLRQLAVDLLPALSSNPSLQIASLTTTSPQALLALDEGETAFLDARFGDAIERFERSVQLDPDFAFAHYRLSQAYEWNERYDEAVGASRRALSLASSADRRSNLYIQGWHHFLQGEAEQARSLYTNLRADWPYDIEALYGLVKVNLIYNPYGGRPRSDALPFVEALVSLSPGWGDVHLHRLEFAAMDGELARFDSILASVDPGSKVAAAWQLSRRLSQDPDPGALPRLAGHIQEPEVFAYAIGQLDGFFDEPELADQLVEYFANRPEWSGTDWEAGARLYSGTFDVAQGQWSEGIDEIRSVRGQNRAWSIEFEALYSGLPDRPDQVQAATEAQQALLGWTPSTADESLMPFMAVHTGKHEYLREYLLGLTDVWMGRPEDASDNVAALRNTLADVEPGQFARELGKSLAGHQASALGDDDAALNWLTSVHLAPTVPEIVSSPFFVLPHDRYLLATIYLGRGELDEAERWFRSLTEAWDFPYVAAGYAGLARVHAAWGDDVRADLYAGRAADRLGLSEPEVERLLDSVRRGLVGLTR